ncbi:MAG: cytochrome c biogenesis protein CcdA [Actinobacteria bacterium]|nr:cytochrome c biogenesis protein CcdA [Actinomycetota bacterium]
MASLLTLAADDPTRPLYFLTAFAAGIVSFLSPCVLPIVPAYLSLITGLTVGDLKERDTKVLPRIALDTGLFVAGFTVVFVLLGLITTAVGDALFENQTTLTRVSGVLIILMALYLAGSQVLMTPRLYQEFRFHPHLDRFGAAATPIAGAAFGFAWTPCIGPVLGAVLSFAAQGQSLARAGILLIAYSLGLGCSFLAVGLAFGRLTTPLEWCKRHARAITFVSAAVLFAFGIVLVTDNFTVLTARLSSWLDAIGLGRLLELG